MASEHKSTVCNRFTIVGILSVVVLFALVFTLTPLNQEAYAGAPPAQVTGLTVIQDMANEAELDWDDVSGADNYQILRKTNFTTSVEVNTNGTWQFRTFHASGNPGLTAFCSVSAVGSGSTGAIRLSNPDGGAALAKCDLWKHFPRDFLNNTRIQFKYQITHIFGTQFSVQSLVTTINDPLQYDRSIDTDFSAGGTAPPLPFSGGTLIDLQGLTIAGGVIQDDMVDVSANWADPDSDFVTITFRISDSSILTSQPKLDIFWINMTDFDTGLQKAFYNFSGSSVTNERPSPSGCNNSGVGTPFNCPFGIANAGSFITNEIFEEIGTSITSDFEDSTIPLQGVSTYKVRATNTSGFGDNSTEVDFGLIQAIENLDATTINSTAIQLSWNLATTVHPTDPLTGVLIQRNGTTITTVDELDISFVDTGLVPDTNYIYLVKGVSAVSTGAFGTSASNTTLVGGMSPDQVTGLNATATSNSIIDLEWAAPADGGSPITGYKIERESPVGGGFITIIADTASTSTTFSDTGLATSTQYNYKVSAINAIGTGPASNESDATTFDVTATLEGEKDSFLRQGSPNRNEGINEIMQLRANGNNRALVEFNQTEIENAVGTATLDNATLRLYIEDNFNGWGSSGRTIDAHRITETWAEGNAANLGGNIPGTGDGVTWKCAVDTDISDQNKDCTTEWGGGNFDGTATDSLTITNGQEGVYVEFDVTADVQDFLDGTTTNHGWIIKKTLEGQAGKLQFTSSDGTANNPELVIITSSSTTAECPQPQGFDVFPNGTVPTTVSFPNPTQVTTEWAACGLALLTTTDPDGPQIFNFAHAGKSPPNLLAGCCGSTQFFEPIGVEFTVPVSDVSIKGLGVGCRGLILEGFNSANALVDSDSVVHSSSGANNVDILSISGSDIVRVDIRQVFPTLVCGFVLDGYAVDDLAYTFE